MGGGSVFCFGGFGGFCGLVWFLGFWPCFKPKNYDLYGRTDYPTDYDGTLLYISQNACISHRLRNLPSFTPHFLSPPPPGAHTF